MNPVIQSLTDHRSIRSYTEAPVSEEHLDLILRAAQAAPSSINGQQATVICVQDAETRRKIAKFAGGQPWIERAPVFLLFCADFYRASIAAEITGQSLAITDSVESVIVGACDVGISVAYAMAAAESLGLGTVTIGGIRGQPQAIIELLDIPRHVFPVCGLVVGHPADRSELKPRLPREAVCHREKYNRDVRPLIEAYDEQLAAHMTRVTQGRITQSWSETVAGFYNRVYFPEVRQMLDKQGFGNN